MRNLHNEMVISKYTRNAVENLTKKENEEAENGTLTEHRMYRYEEAKLMQGLFNPMLGNAVGKYQRPW